MFRAKQNIAKPSNPSLKSKEASPFIKPEMKVIKPEKKQEEVALKEPKKIKKEESVTQKASVLEASEKEKGEKKEGGDKVETLKKVAEKQSFNGVKNSAKDASVSVTEPKSNNTTQVKIEAKEGKKEKEETSEKDKKEEGAVKEKKIPKAPTKPEDDPAFQQQIKKTEKVKEEKSQHPDPESKVGEQQQAGHPSAAVQSAKNDQQAHADSLSATSEEEKKREPFTPESFKKLLEKNLDDLEKQLPKNSEEAQEFRDEKPIQGIKENISGQVTAESDKLAGPMKSEADKPAPASGQPTVEAVPLPPTNSGSTPKPLNAKAAIPKPKTSQEISMEKESQSLDDYMAENKVTDEQLAKSNEPKFTGALEEKNSAQTEAKLAPVKYRKKEQVQLGVAQKTATVNSKEGLDQIQAAKVLSENNVLASQTENKTSDKTEQEKIYAEFEAIYEETKKTVTESLEKLSEDVDKKFSEEAESAQKTFEENVEDGLGEIYGWTVIDDWIFGEDTEAIDKLFRVEKAKFISKMNSVLDDISIIIADGLNGALDAIAEGKKKSKEKFDSLDESQKKLAEDAYSDFNDQYADLEDTVYEKQEELAADLAQSYKENVDSLQEKFNEIKESVSAGWIGAALNALAGVIKTILKIKDMLLNLLAAAVSAIGAIISDPIGFLSNLIQGVKQGFVDFGNNIKKHMIKGVIEWLTGSLGNVGITLPDNLFSLSGIFSLVTQMLGLTWDYFRSKAVKLLGEPVVAGMEKAVEIFQIVRKDGVMGLWEYIKEQFSNLKEMVMDAIRDMIITKVIEAGIKWVMGLLSPAGAFVKAAMMIIDIVKFFVERAAQIFELVTAFINSIKALAEGNVKAVAKGIETALAKAIPVLIGFLAALVGVTGLTGKIQKIIKKVRKKIDKAINKVIKKAKKIFNKILGKKKPKKGHAKKIKDDNKKQKPAKLTAKDKAKHKKIVGKIEKKLGEKAKKGEPFDKFYTRKKKEAKTLENKYQPQLKKGINLDIKFNALAKDKEDNDVDIKIKIAPNDTTGKVQAKGDEKDNLPLLDQYLNKKVVDKEGIPLESFTKALKTDINKIDKKQVYILDKRNSSYKFRTGKGFGSYPNIYIESDGTEEGVLKKGKSKSYKPAHGNFIPDEMELMEKNGVYTAEYKTKRAGDAKEAKAGEDSPTFEINITFDEAIKGISDKVQTRKVKGFNLSSKPDGIGRGKWDGGSAGKDGTPGFDNAHIIGDQFGGSGVNSAMNIYPSSPMYNQKEMAHVENKLASFFKSRGTNFNMEVTAKIKDDVNVNNQLKGVLDTEFGKDNKGKKKVDEKIKAKAKSTLTKALQQAMTMDIDNLPGQFLNTTYKSKGIASKDDTEVEGDNLQTIGVEMEKDKRYDKDKYKKLGSDFSKNGEGTELSIGADQGYDASIENYKAKFANDGTKKKKL
ncbi:DNA/RNA non-specific endonuclease [Tenacibaculum sp. Mcav3-52]|uniref:DNA/RNA non-specific endonuclease n=1 Tax=Tenacibaculum sp. Mcav3-52 TaxID=2917762 RepID=UPI001EF3341B|nr:DNA/RNA non-specific endonuclease [Tenacibaculum sp. Mcav3-52]MCG7501120.1 DNA/RNA non-specific endonuclease [Tenacibaculum sp. Mcav3-52]